MLANEMFNIHRESLGLKPLVWSGTLHQIAWQHSYNMALPPPKPEDTTPTNYAPFGHYDQELRFQQIRNRIGGVVATAENILLIEKETDISLAIDRAVVDWLQNDPDKANIEGDFTHCAITFGENKDSGQFFFTQLIMKVG